VSLRVEDCKYTLKQKISVLYSRKEIIFQIIFANFLINERRLKPGGDHDFDIIDQDHQS